MNLSALVALMRSFFGRRTPAGRAPAIPSPRPPLGPPGTGPIAMRFVRFDGIAGTERGRFLVTFPPDKVQPGDHLTKGAFKLANGTEVPCAVIDLGYRHVLNGQIRGVRGYIVEADGTQGADLTQFATGTFDPGATPTQTRLTPLGVRRYSNPLPIGVVAGATAPALVAPFTWWHGSDDFPRRHPGNDVVMTYQHPSWYVASNFTFTPSGTGYTRLDFMLALKEDGTPIATLYANPAINQSLKSVSFFQPQDNMGNTMWNRYFPGTTNPYQIVGLFYVFVPAGLAFTLGVTPLDTPGIVVTTYDGTYKPYSFLPDNGPIAGWVPAGADYNSSTDFTIGLVGTRQDFVDKGHTAAYDAWVALADLMWRLEGAAAVMDASQYTSYFPTMNMHEFYASNDGVRFIMRAVHYSRHFRDKVLGHGPTWTTWQVNEAHADSATHLFDAMLTGDHSYLAGPSWMIYSNEFQQMTRSTGSTNLKRSGTGRHLMHGTAGLTVFECMQIQAASVPNGHVTMTLNLSTNGAGQGDQEGWLNADGTSKVDGKNLVTAITNADRARRLHEFERNWMTRPEDTTSLYATQNAGLVYLNLSDYKASGNPNNWGFGTWMQADIMSWNVKSYRVFGEFSGAREMIEPAMEFLYQGVSTVNGGAIYTGSAGGFAGQERFIYGGGNGTNPSTTPSVVTASSGYSGVLTNGFYVPVQQWLYEKTGDVKWRDRTRTLIDATPKAANQGDAMYYFLKSVGEVSAHTLLKPI